MRFALMLCGGVMATAACGRSPAPGPATGPVEDRFTIEIGVVPGVSATAAIVRERTTWVDLAADGQTHRLPQITSTRAGWISLPVDQPFDQVLGGVITNGRTQTLRLSGIISGSATHPWQRVTLSVMDDPGR